MRRERLDLLLVQRGLAESRARAQWLIRNGRVRVDGAVCRRSGALVDVEAPIVVWEPLHYVSRGGLKLEHALWRFRVPVAGCTALDCGASTGGFTDCLLQHGAGRVYAVDVGHGQMHPRLRQDERVVVLEGVDIRRADALPPGVQVDLAVVDVSFISLRAVLPAVLRWLEPEGWLIALIKPQFEAGPGAVGRRGVVRRPERVRQAVGEVLRFAHDLALGLIDLTLAPPDSERGNVEVLACWRRGAAGLSPEEALVRLEGEWRRGSSDEGPCMRNGPPV
ncbi:MAG: TlyA family RNA methyltransferase [Chloroflexia bacterium]